MSKVSVIIVNFNSGHWLNECLKSLIDSSFKDIEVIIVDNNSNDESLNCVEKYKNELEIILHKSSVNLGFSAGNNLGVKLSKGDVLFILNPDAMVEKDCISNLLKVMNQLSSDNVILAPQLQNIDGSHQVSYHKILSVKDVIKDLFFLNYVFKSKNYLCKEEICECESLSGAALILSKKRWLELGGFDETLFWKEDMDLCYRNKKSGGKNYYVKSAVAKHYSGGSSDKNRDIVVANQIFSALKFFQKHSDRFTLMLVSFLIFLNIITRMLVYSLFFWKLSIRKRIKGYFLALKNFFKWIFKNEQSIVT